jgi:hypothetical protein
MSQSFFFFFPKWHVKIILLGKFFPWSLLPFLKETHLPTDAPVLNYTLSYGSCFLKEFVFLARLWHATMGGITMLSIVLRTKQVMNIHLCVRVNWTAASQLQHSSHHLVTSISPPFKTVGLVTESAFVLGSRWSCWSWPSYSGSFAQHRTPAPIPVCSTDGGWRLHAS